MKKYKQEDILLDPTVPLKVVEMGNVTELLYILNRNTKQTVLMLPDGQYCNISTGEIKDCIKHNNRSELKNSLYRTFRALRNVINANVVDVDNVRWITLTYADNMTNTVQLYKDFEKFNKRFQYHIKKLGYNKAEYITVAEPQGRGAWHMHLLYFFDKKAPFLQNDTVLAPMWSHGFTKIKKLDNVDNVGAYLTAYLGDMDLQDLFQGDNLLDYLKYNTYGDELNMQFGDIRISGDENGNKKYIVKGGRLPFYPLGFRIYRCSRGVNRPVEYYLPQKKAEKLVSKSKLVYEKSMVFEDAEKDYFNVVNKRQYNSKRQ